MAHKKTGRKRYSDAIPGCSGLRFSELVDPPQKKIAVIGDKVPKIELTSEQLLEVPCIVCNAEISQPCSGEHAGHRYHLIEVHPERMALRKKLPAIKLDTSLGATDKAIIIYYAFVMLCDSVSVHSESIMGKKLSSTEIQIFFGQQAVAAARQDGLIDADEKDPGETLPS